MRFGKHPALPGSGVSYAFIRALQPAAWFSADRGVTVTGSGASMVADQADSDNALVLPGVSGNYASTPDSVPLSITGDIDLIARVAPNDWTPGALQMIIAKSGGDPNRQFNFYIAVTGELILQWFPTGSAASVLTSTSTVATGATDGSAIWVRVTLDVDNGAAGNDTKFYTAADSTSVPSSWTQLGSTVTKAGTTTMVDTSAALEVGSRVSGTADYMAGKVYRAIVKSGIDGTTVFDANFAAQSKGTTSFSESSSNAATVTVNQSGALPAHIGSQKDLLQGTDASRPPYLSYSGTKYLYLPGVAGNNASTPDAAANSITGNIDLRAHVALDDYTPAANQELIAKDATGGQFSYLLRLRAVTGVLDLYWSEDGTALKQATSTAATAITDGAQKWIRATMDVNNGSGAYEVKFWLSDDNVTYTQLGNAVTGAATTSIFNGTSVVYLGYGQTSLASVSGKLYRAIIKSGIDGTTVVDFNPSDTSDASTSFASSTTGETWTINSSGGLKAQIVGRASLLFDGSADYLKTNAFTLNQPETVLLAFKQVSWTAADSIADGNAAGTGLIYQTAAGASPQIDINAGSAVATNSNLAVGSYGVLCAVFNGASSSLQINLTTPTTGNAGIGNMGAFTLGARPTPGNYANIQVLEAIILPTALSTTQIARAVQYLAGRHGIAL